MGVSESTFAAETVGVSTVGATDVGVTVAAVEGAVIAADAAGVPAGLVPLADEFRKLPPTKFILGAPETTLILLGLLVEAADVPEAVVAVAVVVADVAAFVPWMS